ncbi:MAG: glycosyltransferase family 39 protein, partial [Elusimicrobiota bacterium]
LNMGIIFITILAFIVRLYSLFLLGRHNTPEVWEYDTIALNMIQQKGYIFNYLNTTYHSYIYPVYPFLTALSHLITGRNYFVLEIFQIILSAVTCYFIYLIAKLIFNQKVGLLSSFLVALHPGLIVYSTKLHELTLVIFLLTVIFWLIISLDYSKVYNNIFTGILIGIGVLTRPTFVFFLPVYFSYIWLNSKRFKYALKAILAVTSFLILIILPWTIRNYQIHKRWIFITTNSAEHFWRGNNSAASGSALTEDGYSIIEKAPTEIKEKIYKMTEIEQYDFFYKEAYKFIGSNPGFFIKMVLRKFFYFCWFSPQVGLLYPGLWKIVYMAYYGILFFTFIFGLYTSLFKKRLGINRAAVVSIVLFLFLTSLLHALFYVEIRHRWAIEPLMLIFSAFGLTELWRKITLKDSHENLSRPV